MAATDFITTDEACRRIRTGLRKRTGLAWSVRRGRGTGYGWIRINSPRGKWGDMPHIDRDILAAALGLDSVGPNGISIPSSNDYYAEYVDRAEGREPSVRGVRYWD